ncbi:MAG: HAMP domain-containing protein [Desulfobacteraceae bacterium]|nr:HAMP domain-containing protein [Desulfobacteraceae bacterium]
MKSVSSKEGIANRVMREWPLKTSLWRKPRFIPLQFRFIILTSSLVTLLLAILAIAVGVQQSREIRSQVERRGMGIAQSLAATSKSALTTYSYVALSQTASQAAQDPDLAYVIIHDKEGRVAGHSSRRDVEGTFLQDDVSRRALLSKDMLIQNVVLADGATPALELAVPVSVPGSDRIWGVVRVGMSLDPMHRQIRNIQLMIAGVGILALSFSVLGCIWLARRITNPVGLLVNATVSAARGELEQEIHIATGDEVEVLADNFTIMIREILLQRGKLEQQLLEITALQRYLNKLLTTMSDGLLSVDLSGNLVTVNPAACEILEISPGTGESRQVEHLLPNAPELLRFIRAHLSPPRSAGQAELHVGPENEGKIIIAASSILTDEGNAPQQIIVNIHDITELKRLEARFRQTERLAALGTLSAGMAHEIRNPLSAIKTFVQLLPRKLEKPGFLEKFNRTVPRELERINRLIEDLLELARVPRYHFTPIQVRSLLEHAAELFEEELLLHKITLHMDIAAGLPLIWASPDQLTKAFNNLMQNAIQAMPDGGDLHVRAFPGPPPDGLPGPGDVQRDRKKSWLNLVFSDTGVGIKAEDMKAMFNPFFTTKDSGTGLGLAITHKVITEHGGQIEVKSAPGLGTCFTVLLPVKEFSERDAQMQSKLAS